MGCHYKDYINSVSALIAKAQSTLLQEQFSSFTAMLDELSIKEFIAHAIRQIDQITRRVMNEEKNSSPRKSILNI